MYVAKISLGADMSFLAIASLIWPGFNTPREISASMEDGGVELGDDITRPS